MAALTELFTTPFIMLALVTGILISFCAALLGVILVLKRYSMIGHGLADVAFAAVSLAVALGLQPSDHIFVTLPVVVAASFVIMQLSKRGTKGDVAIGMVSTGSLAAGIIITAVAGGFNVDVSNYMFGSILASTKYDMYMALFLTVFVLAVFIVFYNRLFIITYDESYAEASGINVTFYQFLISFLTALTIVIGMKIMGTLLISSLIIFPAITAKRLVGSFKRLIGLSAAISVVCCFSGFCLSYFCNLPIGASIVMSNIVLCALASLVTWRKNR